MADTRNNLGNNEITVSDYLRSKHLAATLYWGARSRSGEAYLGIDPDLRWIPDAEAGATIRPGGQQADLSVGWGDKLRAITGVRRSPFDSGTTGFEQLSSQWGPGEVFWGRAQQEGFPDRKTDKFGGSLTLGPLRLSGEERRTTSTPIPIPFREGFTNPEMKERERIAQLSGQYALGNGLGNLWGSLQRKWKKSKLPQYIREQQPREFSSPHETSGLLGWTGDIGRVPVNARLRYARTQDQKSLWEAYIEGRIPF